MNELKVGLLTLLALASLVVVSLKITSNKTGFGKYIEYKTIVEDASGIYENSSIKVAGIVAGRIKTIELNGSQALITFDILDQIKITANSKLRIKTVGFLGDKYIDVFLGDPNAERLKGGALISAHSGAGFEELGKDASEILADVKDIAKTIKESLYDENNQNIVKQLLTNIRDVSQSLKNVVTGNEKKLNDTIANLDKIAKQLSYETDRYADGSFMNDLEQLKPILSNVDKAVADLKDIVADVKEGKGTVGKLLRDDEIIDQVNETLSGVNRLVNRANNYKTDISFFSGMNSDDASRTEFNVDLIPGPERFFRMGVVVSDYGRKLTTETVKTTAVDSNTPTVTSEVKENKDDYKFNLQIGRRINHFAFRAGIIESTGGLGMDYIAPDYGFRASLDTFDFDKDLGPFVRLSTELRLWSVVYAKVQGEDLASKSGDQSYTVMAGLRFNDEDLATLIGLLAN